MLPVSREVFRMWGEQAKEKREKNLFCTRCCSLFQHCKPNFNKFRVQSHIVIIAQGLLGKASQTYDDLRRTAFQNVQVPPIVFSLMGKINLQLIDKRFALFL